MIVRFLLSFIIAVAWSTRLLSAPLRNTDLYVDRHLPRFNCSEHYRNRCLNNGLCYIQIDVDNRFRAYCACSPGYRGRRCELIHDDNIYLPSMQEQKLEMVALSALVTLIVIAICIVSLAFYIYRRRVRLTRCGLPSISFNPGDIPLSIFNTQ